MQPSGCVQPGLAAILASLETLRETGEPLPAPQARRRPRPSNQAGLDVENQVAAVTPA
jgi:hypothetical protein